MLHCNEFSYYQAICGNAHCFKACYHGVIFPSIYIYIYFLFLHLASIYFCRTAYTLYVFSYISYVALFMQFITFLYANSLHFI
jgi:hypothetical protein